MCPAPALSKNTFDELYSSSIVTSVFCPVNLTVMKRDSRKEKEQRKIFCTVALHLIQEEVRSYYSVLVAVCAAVIDCAK